MSNPMSTLRGSEELPKPNRLPLHGPLCSLKEPLKDYMSISTSTSISMSISISVSMSVSMYPYLYLHFNIYP